MMKPLATLLLLLFTLDSTEAQITREECVDQGGTVVYDIGDGAIFRSNYLCETTNEPPTDIITGNPVAKDGEVCCGGTGDGIGTSVDRPEMTRDECTSELGGVIVADPGDGTTHSWDYICISSGLPPIGTIVDQPISDEGEVCCETGNSTKQFELSREECTAMNGVIVGDIGDGAIHSPDYVCESSGSPPLGTIVDDTGAIAIEGEVCCPAGSSGERPIVTRDECTLEMGGVIVGDIGDGAIHSPDYICETSGLPPIGTVVDTSSGFIAREGEVCCEAGNSESANGTRLPELTRNQCIEMSGVIVGDIGDGAIHSPDYVCESSGMPPIGSINDSSGAIAIDGEVCCGTSNSTNLPKMTRDECMEMDGLIVGDIGDGAIHSPNYVCESSGMPPIGTINDSSGAIAIEGEVCCGIGNSTNLPEMTRDECMEMDGLIVGDIGDGAIHSPGYACVSSGLPPIGTIVETSGAIAIEGEICCGANSSSTQIEKASTTSGSSHSMHTITEMVAVALGFLFLIC